MATATPNTITSASIIQTKFLLLVVFFSFGGVAKLIFSFCFSVIILGISSVITCDVAA